ncbi:MAG: hypothetical protein GTO63_11335 [Anaerolineae bacterium]|nr:hypothetical protein [Anaerolineae bacterium]NIN95459.1 hypothetical protein [Anaerolineae bacterium]NIQ78434.1 hypothetical protein [Anaerolineae bacterium]
MDWAHSGSFAHYLITGARVPHFYHSQHRNIPALRNAHPEPLAEISADLAGEIDVADGEELKIETKVGAAVFKATIVDGIHPRAVSIPHGWAGPHNANWLIDDLSCDPLSGAPPYRDMRCRVTKA